MELLSGQIVGRPKLGVYGPDSLNEVVEAGLVASRDFFGGIFVEVQRLNSARQHSRRKFGYRNPELSSPDSCAAMRRVFNRNEDVMSEVHWPTSLTLRICLWSDQFSRRALIALDLGS